MPIKIEMHFPTEIFTDINYRSCIRTYTSRYIEFLSFCDCQNQTIFFESKMAYRNGVFKKSFGLFRHTSV